MAGRYREYPDYEVSDDDWMQAIPRDWKVMPLKMISSIYSGSTPKSGETAYWDGDIAWITPADMGKANSPYIAAGAKNISLSGYESCGTTMVPPGTVILSSRAPIGTLGIASNSLCTNQGCKSLVVNTRHVSKYLFYFLSCNVEKLNILGRGTTFLELSSFELGSYKIVVPSKKEQTQIVNFLNYETAKIDRLIEKQQQLIKLLKEKRQAVISHAVTKGLDPNASMRDSGVEWLGDVPAHWKILKGNFIGKLFGSEVVSENNIVSHGGIPYLKVSTLSKEGFIPENPKFFLDGIDKEDMKTNVDFIVFPKRGAAIFTNKVNIIENESLLDPNLMGWKIGAVAQLEFIAYLLKRLSLEDIADISTVPQINNKHINAIKFPIPPVQEQVKIIKYLKLEIGKFQRLVGKTSRAITLLNERRTALISAAVMGKIDVRDWQPPVAPINNKECTT